MCDPVVGYAVGFNGLHLMGRGGEGRIWILGERFFPILQSHQKFKIDEFQFKWNGLNNQKDQK